MTETLDRLVALAAALVNAPMAAFIEANAGRIDILSGFNVPALAYAADIDSHAAGFAPDQPAVVADTHLHPYFAQFPLVTGAPFLRALIRLPVPGPGRLALIAGYREPITEPDPARIAALGELASLAAREVEIDILHRPPRTSRDLPLAELIARADHSPEPTALIDHQLRYLHVNPAMAALNMRSLADTVGHSIHEIGAPSVKALEAIFAIALRDGRSFEQVELVGERHGDTIRVFSISCHPLNPRDRSDPIIEVLASDVTALRASESRLEDRLVEAPVAPPGILDPTVKFLSETLVRRQGLRQRKTISYMTLRTWRKPIRTYQIEALKALKSSPPRGLIETAAAEIVQAVQRVVGAEAFSEVTAVPCGRSHPDRCLSQLIAQEVAARLGKPMTIRLQAPPQKGGSHPKENVRRPPLKLLSPAEGPCLVIDDVATSGAHIEEAIVRLRPSAGSVFAVAWIGGDADETLDAAP
jgi:predicted amidophosphoribosyltransferase/PAS domain-containing protein